MLVTAGASNKPPEADSILAVASSPLVLPRKLRVAAWLAFMVMAPALNFVPLLKNARLEPSTVSVTLAPLAPINAAFKLSTRELKS